MFLPLRLPMYYFLKMWKRWSLPGPDKVRYYFERMVGTIVSILAPISILIFLIPHLFIMILAGSKYYAAVPILQTVILFSFLRPFSYQFGTTMDAIGKPSINFWVNLLTMSIELWFHVSRFALYWMDGSCIRNGCFSNSVLPDHVYRT